MEDNEDNNQDLENLIIKDKEYLAKKRKKYLLIGTLILSIIIVIIAITIVLVIVLKPKIYNEIVSQYQTKKGNENIPLHNINNNIKFKIIIGDTTFENKNNITLEKAGKHIIIIEFENELDSLEGLFEGNHYLIEADFSKLQTEKIKSMENLFKDCSNLTKVDFNNKTPNLQNARNMFYGCDSLTSINMQFDTSKVTRMDYMFYHCEKITNIDITSFNLENLKNATSMFEGCFALKNIKFNDNTLTKNLEDMNKMFYYCSSLECINMKIFNENKVTNLNYVFYECGSLIEIDLSYFESKYITELKGTFQDCKKLEKINLRHFNAPKVVIMNNMFYNCKSLTYLDLSYFNLENLVNSSYMFSGCINLKEIKFNKNTITKNLEDMNNMFENCRSLEYINMKIFKENKLKNLNFVFSNCKSLKEIDLSYFETKFITEAKGTFENCMELKKINLNYFNTSKITAMDHMSEYCQSLTYLDLSYFNLENLVDSMGMFDNCLDLKVIKFNNNTTTKNL